MTETIKITVPETAINFDIGGKVYTLSLADKSRAKITEEYRAIETHEIAANKHIEDLQGELQYKLSHVKRDLTDQQAKQREEALQADFTRKFNFAADQAETYGQQAYPAFLDTLFGAGSGAEIYETCGRNTVAVSKVIGIVMAKMNAANDVEDYMQKYAKEVDALKQEAEGDVHGLNGEK
ncbi:hypothetical protein [Lacticaseibacillus parakribbianus]|uniref:hypothetical protein n=1 Tax=Lacticaseibacillus parakribbianus TaxID=2970927 RepID=UPI0021CAF75D|nr:hypothetical protein [Lacticaseibacillus parakribbianus]